MSIDKQLFKFHDCSVSASAIKLAGMVLILLLTPLPPHRRLSWVNQAGLDIVAPAPAASIDFPLAQGSCVVISQV